ncbi:MAG: TfoX/Sxy family protein [Rudaea sp.]
MAVKDTNKIRNVGPKSAAWLRQVGVRTQDDLEQLGPVEAFMKVKRAGFRPSLNLLYSLAGAIADCHWTDLSDERKAELVQAAQADESGNPIKTRWQKQVERSEVGMAEDADSQPMPDSGFLDDADAAHDSDRNT